jgi:hypothetical protein
MNLSLNLSGGGGVAPRWSVFMLVRRPNIDTRLCCSLDRRFSVARFSDSILIRAFFT